MVFISEQRTTEQLEYCIYSMQIVHIGIILHIHFAQKTVEMKVFTPNLQPESNRSPCQCAYWELG